jgi:hypothetical protein
MGPTVHRLVWVIALALCVIPIGVVQSAEPAGGAAPVNKLAAEWENWLRTSDQVVLVSIDPRARFLPSDPKPATGYRELGRLPLQDPVVRAQVSDALVNAIAAGGEPSKCFVPRHLIEATKNGKSVSFVICFQCGWIHVVREGKEQQVLTISHDAEVLFNQLLSNAGIPLAP